MEPDAIAKRLEDFATLCRRRGIPLTVQRRVVLETVLQRSDHPTADQIVEAVRQRARQISRTTVYRVLDTLVDMEMIHRLAHPGSAVRYDGTIRRHHHLICKRCLKVIDWDDSRLNRIRPPEVPADDFEIEDFSIHFVGLCGACRRQEEARLPHDGPQ